MPAGAERDRSGVHRQPATCGVDERPTAGTEKRPAQGQPRARDPRVPSPEQGPKGRQASRRQADSYQFRLGWNFKYFSNFN